MPQWSRFAARPTHSASRVRWFDLDADFRLMRERWRAVGASMTRAESKDLQREGYRYCGIVEEGAIVASAAVWMYSPAAWKLAAVWTREDRRSMGYATAACSFATAHIV